MQGHVQIGASYTLIATRVGLSGDQDPDDEIALTGYAVALAKALDAVGTPPIRLEVELCRRKAEPTWGGGPRVVELRVGGDVARDAAGLRELAAQVLRERTATGAWRLAAQAVVEVEGQPGAAEAEGQPGAAEAVEAAVTADVQNLQAPTQQPEVMALMQSPAADPPMAEVVGEPPVAEVSAVSPAAEVSSRAASLEAVAAPAEVQEGDAAPPRAEVTALMQPPAAEASPEPTVAELITEPPSAEVSVEPSLAGVLAAGAVMPAPAESFAAMASTATARSVEATALLPSTTGAGADDVVASSPRRGGLARPRGRLAVFAAVGLVLVVGALGAATGLWGAAQPSPVQTEPPVGAGTRATPAAAIDVTSTTAAAQPQAAAVQTTLAATALPQAAHVATALPLATVAATTIPQGAAVPAPQVGTALPQAAQVATALPQATLVVTAIPQAASVPAQQVATALPRAALVATAAPGAAGGASGLPVASNPPRPLTLLDTAPLQGAPNVPAWPDEPNSTAWFAPDGFHLFARQVGQFVAVNVLADQRLRDGVVTAVFHKTSGPSGGGYGIILRDQGPAPRDGRNQSGRYYVFEVGDRGEIGIWRRDQDQWIDILPWTANAAVHVANAENTLVATARGTQLTLEVNGVEVATRTDAVLDTGGVGVFVGGDQNHAVLTHLLIQSDNN